MTGLAFSIQGRIASIVFDRPNEQNLLSRDLLLELRTIAKDLVPRVIQTEGITF